MNSTPANKNGETVSLLKEALKLSDLEMPKIVAVGLTSQGKILTGKRRDNGLWTNPGGHMDDGETIFQAARREVFEEAGIELTNEQLELVGAERVTSHRTGKEFVIFALTAEVPQERTTTKHDPDNEVDEWKWVPISKQTPELKPEARHAKQDHILMHLGVWPEDVRMAEKGDELDKGRTMKQVSDDIQKANMEEEEETPPPPEPQPKTPEQLNNNPDEYIPEDDVTGD